MFYVSKGELRQMVDEYRYRLRALVHENYQLRRDLRAATEHIRNTENFLAVLQGEHIATTEPT